MFRVYLIDKKLIVFDKTEKEFRQKYGNNFEQVTIIKDQDNIDQVTEKLSRQYKAEVEKDCHIKKKFGWKYWSDEVKERIRHNISIAMSRHVRTKEHSEAISRYRKGKSIFEGQKHSNYSKKLIAFARKGKDPIQGRKWMHNPITGKEARGYELAEGMIWGRSPEASELTLAANAKKKMLKKQKESNRG